MPAPRGDRVPSAHDGLLGTIDDVALIFEGGGMRASYTAGVVVTLLEQCRACGQIFAPKEA